MVTVDGRGRIVIPEAVREALGIAPGDALAVEVAGEALVLRPVRGHAIVTHAIVTKQKGVWTRQSGPEAAEIPELKDRVAE